MDQDFANAARPLLEQQLSVTTELLTTLQTEYKVLKQMDSCDLTSSSQQKQALIEQLEGLSQAWLRPSSCSMRACFCWLLLVRSQLSICLSTLYSVCKVVSNSVVTLSCCSSKGRAALAKS